MKLGIFKAMKLFSSADELIKFVEETLTSDELPAALLDARSEYRALLKQRIGRRFIDIVDLGTRAFAFYREMLNASMVNEMFNTEKHRRFLMHLIGHHIKIYYHNLIIAKSNDPKRGESGLSSSFGLMSRYFNHSCYPHALMVPDEVFNSVYVTVRPIREGQEVLTSWFPFLLDCKRKERQCTLWELSQTRCKCSRCRGVVASYQERQPLDRALDMIISMVYSEDSDYDEVPKLGKDTKEELKEECIDFLQTYGHLDWCGEIKQVMKMYRSYLSIQPTIDHAIDK